MTASMAPRFFIGCAAGFSGDRVDAASPVVDTLIRLAGGPGDRACLMFETLAERTLALAQLRRRADHEGGYEPLLDAMLRPVLRRCLDHRIAIVGNFGAAHPIGAAGHILRMARELGLREPRVAVVEGDDLNSPEHAAVLRAGFGEALLDKRVVSANAYIGARSIADALRDGADIVVAGRVADPSLVLGPAWAHHGWAEDDWDALAGATMAGHLLECGAQLCGGYFADPGYKDVPDLAHVGFPVAEIGPRAEVWLRKADGTGGLLCLAGVKEQLLYEVHDPAAYVTPDVVADITQATVVADGEGPPDGLGLAPGDPLRPREVIHLRGVKGHPRTDTLKALVCHDVGWLAEGEISYAGPRAEARARLAAQVLRQRLPHLDLRVDLIGALSIFGDDGNRMLEHLPDSGAQDVRLRVAAACPDRAEAQTLTREVTALYTCGPAGGGGVRTALTPRLGSVSGLVPRACVPTTYRWAGLP